MKRSDFTRGSAEAWDEVWKGAERLYSDAPITQNQVFEHLKIATLSRIFLDGRLAGRREAFKMLEVGCGTAFVSLYFAKKGADVVCLDTNENILKVAEANFKKENVRGRFVVGNAEKLPFTDNSFDLVASFGLLEHFKDPSIAINEMVRVTKNGGVFFADIVPKRFSCQTLGNFFNLIASFLFWTTKGLPSKGWQKGIRNIRPLYFENSLSWREYQKIIEAAGVKNVKFSGNRPFPRLTLPTKLDRIYASIIKVFMPFWRWFDSKGGVFAVYWGAGWWFWGKK